MITHEFILKDLRRGNPNTYTYLTKMFNLFVDGIEDSLDFAFSDIERVTVERNGEKNLEGITYLGAGNEPLIGPVWLPESAFIQALSNITL